MNSERKYNAAHTMDLFFFFFPQTRLRGKSEKAKTARPKRKHRKTSEGIIGDLLLWISFFLAANDPAACGRPPTELDGKG
jgi:hypothetical protein